MKKYVVSIVGVLLVLSVAWTVFGQAGQPGQEQHGGGMRAGAGGGGGMRGGFVNREDQLKAIAALQEQIGKLKTSVEAAPQMPAGGFQNATEEERTKMREAMIKLREERTQILDAIDAEVAKLKGAGQLLREQQEGNKELEAIREAATKENAKETLKAIDELIAKRQKALEDRLAKLGLEMPRMRMGGGPGGPGGGGAGGPGPGAGGPPAPTPAPAPGAGAKPSGVK